MAAEGSFDVVIAGGGLAGSTLGGVLAGAGLGVLVVEREPAFRDRIRGEVTSPWGHSEALRAGLGGLLADIGALALPSLEVHQDGQHVDSVSWPSISVDGLPAVAFSHPQFQESALVWARSQGAAVLRPAKVTGLTEGAGDSVTVVKGGRAQQYRARLVVGADGKQSAARRCGADTIVDPEHHRFGGVALSGVQVNSDSVGWAPTPGAAVVWFPREPGSHRVYLRMTAERLRETGVGRAVDSFVGFAAALMPEGSMDNASQAGPLGFFPNSCTWPSQVAGGHVVLVRDAAGAVDPSQGLGTSLLFRDVRELSQLLIGEDDWDRATQEFATRRQAYYAVLRAYDQWCAVLEAEEGPEADRRRELHGAARETDPTLGGFATLEAVGPDGLIPDETARRIYFGESTH
jgi:menaquinone-9 beta-reductase